MILRTTFADTRVGTNLASIANGAFSGCSNLAGLMLPASLTNLGTNAFAYCAGLRNVTIPGNLTNLSEAFTGCIGLTNVLLANGIASLAANAFFECSNLTTVTFPASLTSLGTQPFALCPRLAGVYFLGNAPTLGGALSSYATYASGTVYYLAGTTGWGATFGGLPTALWNPPLQTGSGSFGVLTNAFSFAFTGVSNQTVIVQACTNLANPVWVPVATNTLTGGTSQFSDPQWTNYPVRYYRTVYPTMP